MRIYGWKKEQRIFFSRDKYSEIELVSDISVGSTRNAREIEKKTISQANNALGIGILKEKK